MTTREQVRQLAVYIIDTSGRYSHTVGNEEGHEAHSWHDDAGLNPRCVHCALYRLRRPDVNVDGDRAVGALVQLAASILTDRGHIGLAEWLGEPEALSERLAEEAGL